MKKLAIKTLMIFSFSLISLGLFADPPGMPGGHGTDGDAPPGGGAPIGAGIGIMVALGAAYGGFRMKNNEE
ncbi:hypothetical protein HNS38_09660 [Lentimicrobium sp. L6]|uniref:hypothetical protein n=1 Tax=Lentimicrobium sp. L6 TaxID=2735916 RepID=UPI001552B141|nr:hypothetical protein [Lentimicrobium sp. L6]NPD85024.1 hypothetical protein [Lentimicrobium sp. L6]